MHNKVSSLICVATGAIEPLVKLIEAGGEGAKGQDSDTFKAEVVQHLLTLQVTHPQLREAIQEACCCPSAYQAQVINGSRPTEMCMPC